MNKDELLKYLVGLRNEMELQDDEFTTHDYAVVAGISDSQARRELARMIKDGKVSRHSVVYPRKQWAYRSTVKEKK